jgi:hypothetical protein
MRTRGDSVRSAAAKQRIGGKYIQLLRKIWYGLVLHLRVFLTHSQNYYLKDYLFE